MRKIRRNGKSKYSLVILVISLFIGVGYAYLTTTLNMQVDVKVSKYVNPNDLAFNISKNAVADNVSSTYVSSATGIDFSKMSSDTNGKGVYLLSSTAGNTNPIYYYRGAVDNNNVKFANFCWKIVRTTETGGVKLIYNGVPDSDGYCTNTTGAATRIAAAVFNDSASDIAYVGYMYGTIGSSDYDEIHKNTNDSAVKKIIDEWYKNNMTAFTSKLEDTVWCNDRSMPSGFGARNRLYANKAPSLECQNENDRFTVEEANGNGALTYPVAMLTADEASYAGGLYYQSDGSANNRTYYLYNAALNWTLSPFAFDSNGTALVFYLGYAGDLGARSVDLDSGSVRPAISLVKGTLISGGDGTSTNPYVVQ